ncbi:DNA polymerase Y family protein [Streptomyces sulphureus]|uniref:DNA polymerase Y family protein n=1 Tax=Streptomyces sulphureus TaxID=47758 RepID=UPI00035E1680|nr:helix-hairpin-helix domain-containing protein [Streptomyces sulphureus]
MSGREGVVWYVRFDLPDGPAAARYPELLALLADVTPVVQALPPDAALADVRGALRYFGRGLGRGAPAEPLGAAAELARLVRLRAQARYGVWCTVGVAVNPQLARMAADACGAEAAGVRLVRPEETAAFLAERPVTALHGVGPATARTLRSYGLDTVGRLAAAPPATLQRILGAASAHRLRERARGVDPTPVAALPPGAEAPEIPGAGVPGSSSARSVGCEHRFERYELDAGVRRRALLTLADELGFRMRGEQQVARALTLTVGYADRTTTVRTRRFPEPTAHTPALVRTAYALHDALGLQRAKVRSVVLRAEELTGAENAVRQLSFDPGAEKARRAEAAADLARTRFGRAAAYPAGLLDAA